MFTQSDYRALLWFSRENARSIRGLEPGPRIRQAEAALLKHIFRGYPRPEWADANWWEREVEAAREAAQWWIKFPEMRPEWADEELIQRFLGE